MLADLATLFSLPLGWATLVSLLHVAAALAVTAHAVLSRRDVSAVIGWVGLAWLAPVAGSVLYVLLGINRIRRARVRRRGEAAAAEAPEALMATEVPAVLVAAHPGLPGLAALGGRITGRPLLGGNAIEPLVDGDEAYDRMLAAIDGARTSVTLLTYIFDSDRTGDRFLAALRGAAARGVAVRVLIDAVGARYSRPSMVDRLRRAGVPVAEFLPTRVPWRLPYANLRNHRKVLVVDGRVGFTGGMNIREGHQLSLAPASPVRCLHFAVRGPVVVELQRVFLDDWAFATGTVAAAEGPWFAPAAVEGPVIARGVRDGPDDEIGNLPHVLLGALATATRRVAVVTPYFLPDAPLRAALRVAALRGVRVDIVLPERSNIPVMDWAMMPQLEPLLEAGCRVWRTPPPFDHTKVMVVDGVWSLVGSTNWDPRSLRLNFEYNLECYDRTLAARLEAMVDARMAAGRAEALAALRARTLPVRLRDGVARLLSPYL